MVRIPLCSYIRILFTRNIVLTELSRKKLCVSNVALSTVPLQKYRVGFVWELLCDETCRDI